MVLGGMLRKYWDDMICHQTKRNLGAKTTQDDGQFDVARFATQRVALANMTCCVGSRVAEG